MLEAAYQLRNFSIFIEPIDEEETDGIPSWTECDTIANVNQAELEERLKLLRRPQPKAEKNLWERKLPGLRDESGEHHLKGSRNKIKFDLTPRPVSQTQQKPQAPKAVRFSLDRIDHLKPKVTSKSSTLNADLTHGSLSKEDGDHTQFEELSEEDLSSLIPVTFEDLNIDVDNLYMPKDEEDDSDSVSYVSSESGDYGFACSHSGELSFEIRDDFIDRHENSGIFETKKKGRLPPNLSRPGIKLDYNLVEPERGCYSESPFHPGS